MIKGMTHAGARDGSIRHGPTHGEQSSWPRLGAYVTAGLILGVSCACPENGTSNVRGEAAGTSPMFCGQELSTRATSIVCHDREQKDLAGIENFSALRELDIEGTDIANLAPLAHLKNLETLNTSSTRVSDLTPLAQLPKLKKLVSPGRREIRDVSALKNLTSLESLNLAHTSVEDLRPLSNLSRLRHLNLLDTPVRNLDPLGDLRLRTLVLGSTPVADLAPLTAMDSLEYLDISDTTVAPEQEDMIRRLVPSTRINR
jgi:internalin A